MSKLILGIIIGAMLFVPCTTLALKLVSGLSDANEIYQFNCNASVNSDYGPNQRCNHIAVFDDANNKCYVSYDTRGGQSSISCVKANL